MTTHTKLFDLIISHLDEESGDGDAHIECKYQPKERVAQMFDEHIARLRVERPHFSLRRFSVAKEDTVILFSDGSNENVTFSDAKDEVRPPSWVGLWVRL
jgi:hypothetical protein